MALNYPSSPAINDQYSYNGKTWTYNGSAWDLTVTSLSTTYVSEGANLYYTNARARASLSVSGAGSYDNTTGVITVTGGVTSVGGATGAVSNAQLASSITSSGLLTTANVSELTNLYYTNARVISTVSNQTFSNTTFSGNVNAGNVIIATGGVVRYPDGTTQNTATSTSGTLINIITRTSNVAVALQNRILSIIGRSSNTSVTVS